MSNEDKADVDLNFSESKLWLLWKKYGDIITVVSVVFCLSILAFNLYNYTQYQKEIAENCGWQDETTRCWCQKDYVERMEELELDPKQIDFGFDTSGLEDVKVDK